MFQFLENTPKVSRRSAFVAIRRVAFAGFDQRNDIFQELVHEHQHRIQQQDTEKMIIGSLRV